MVRFKLVSGTSPVATLPPEAFATLAPAYIGDADGLRRAFPRERFPQLIGIGHIVEGPAGAEPHTHYLTLLTETEKGWVPATSDPR
jgi:hypothetical protein